MKYFFSILFVMNASFALHNFLFFPSHPLNLIVGVMNAVVAIYCLDSIDYEIEQDRRWKELLKYDGG